MTPLYDVFNLWASLIKDTDLEKLSNEDLFELSKVYYQFAATRFKECKKDLNLTTNEDNETYIVDELTLEEKTIIATGMVYYWLESKVNYNKLMKNQINTKDYNQLSNANILLRLSELLDYYREEFFRRRKGYSALYPKDWEGWS